MTEGEKERLRKQIHDKAIAGSVEYRKEHERIEREKGINTIAVK